jgi:hypothetical protein
MSEEMLPQPAPMAAPPVFEPKRLKVFGVMHLVFGGLGFLMVALNLVGLLLKGVIEKATSAQGQPGEMVEFQKRINESTAVASWVGVVLGARVAVLILMAGLALVRRKKNSLKASNLYAWVSIGAKVVSLVLFVVIVAPAINGAMDDLTREVPADVKTMMSAVKVGTIASGFVGPVIMAIYPMLALILLNKPLVKDFLSQHGS